MGQKLGGSAPFWGGELGPHLIQRGQARGLPACHVYLEPSDSLATVHQRYRQTDKQDRTEQRSDSIGRTVLETVAQCNFSVFYWILFTLVHCFYWRILFYIYAD